MAGVAPAAGAAGGRPSAVVLAAFLVAACAVVFAGSTAGGSAGAPQLAGRAALASLDVGALEAAAAAALPGAGKARTQALADTVGFASSASHVVYGNDASGDEVELDPVSSADGSGARTQALYDTAGINAGAGGLITPMQRVMVRSIPHLLPSTVRMLRRLTCLSLVLPASAARRRLHGRHVHTEHSRSTSAAGHVCVSGPCHE